MSRRTKLRTEKLAKNDLDAVIKIDSQHKLERNRLIQQWTRGAVVVKDSKGRAIAVKKTT